MVISTTNQDMACIWMQKTLTSFVKHALSLIWHQVLYDGLWDLLYNVLGVGLWVGSRHLRRVLYGGQVILLWGSNSVFNYMFHLGHIWKRQEIPKFTQNSEIFTSSKKIQLTGILQYGRRLNNLTLEPQQQTFNRDLSRHVLIFSFSRCKFGKHTKKLLYFNLNLNINCAKSSHAT